MNNIDIYIKCYNYDLFWVKIWKEDAKTGDWLTEMILCSSDTNKLPIN